MPKIDSTTAPPSPTSTTDLSVLLRRFLSKPLARSAESIEERMERWADVADNPQNHTNGDTNNAVIAARRKVALQSLRKLIKEHPAIAIKLRPDTSREAA